MKSLKKLKGTGYRVFQDFPLNVRKRRIKLLLVRRKILRLNKHINVLVSGDRLYVQNLKFEWFLSGLRHGDSDGSAKLSELIIGADIKDFIVALASNNLPKDYFASKEHISSSPLPKNQ
ncbi:hypothetical protein O3M35_005392 [Rhynocoris fuscipes]|uniref:Uncharacterized protein n=1 Tax=Rhynocoris fuscipes TaxID=488301 RepID=A0AAW1DLS9_9HEMI